MRLRGLVVAIYLVAAPAAAQPVLPGTDGTVCDFVAANAGRELVGLDKPKERIGVYEAEIAFSQMLVKAAVADLDGDGDLEVLSINPLTGTMGGDTPVVYGSAALAGSSFLSDNDDIRWTHAARWLPFGGEWYIVYFEDEALEQAVAVVAATAKPARACNLNADFEETAFSFSGDSAVITAFKGLIAAKPERPWEIKGETGALNAADRSYLTAISRRQGEPLKDNGDSLSAWSVYINPKSSVRSADIDGDGVKERMAFVSISGGGGRGCGALFLELLPLEGKAAPNPALRDLVRAMQGVNWDELLPAPCSGYNDLVEIGDRGYLHINRLGDSDRDHRLKYVRAGRAHDAIKSTFKPTHKVTFDRTKGGPVDNKGDKQ